jgi:hypothetical protein
MYLNEAGCKMPGAKVSTTKDVKTVTLETDAKIMADTILSIKEAK